MKGPEAGLKVESTPFSAFFRQYRERPERAVIAMRRRLTIAVIILASGWVYAEQPRVLRSPDGKYWALRNVKKVAVVCTQGETSVSQRLESFMVEKLKAQGVDALAVHKVFPSSSVYSAKELVARIQNKGVDKLIQLTYSGNMRQDVQVKLVSFKIYSLDGRKPKAFSNNYGGLNTAFVALITELSRR